MKSVDDLLRCSLCARLGRGLEIRVVGKEPDCLWGVFDQDGQDGVGYVGDGDGVGEDEADANAGERGEGAVGKTEAAAGGGEFGGEGG